MFKMSLREVVRSLVDLQMSQKDDEFRQKNSFVVAFDLRLYYSNGSSFWNSCRVAFAFNRPYGPHNGSTHSFVSFMDDQNKYSDWKFLSSHDSCWIDAVNDELRRIYFDFARGIEEKAGEEIAPIEMVQNVWFDIFSKPHWAQTEILKDPNDHNNYKRLIKFL